MEKMVDGKNIANTPPAETKGASLEKLEEVTLLRCYAVLTLVVHHVLCIYLADSWGGIDCPVNGCFRKIFSWFIPEANMPLFTFIAGYLMGYQIERKKYDTFNVFTRKKVHRLLIPYLILGALMIVLQPGIPGGWNGMIYGVPNHMWYCLMLFYCYMLFYIISNFTKEWVDVLVAMGSLALNMKYGSMWILYDKFHIIGGIELPIYFYFWFWLGSYIFKHRQEFFSITNAMLLLTVYLLARPHVQAIFRNIAYILVLLQITYWLVHVTKWPEWVRKLFGSIAMCSFGIYVFHHLFLWDATHIDILSQYVLPLCSEHYVLMPIALTMVAFAMSWGVTALLLKTKTGKYLLA